MSRIAPLLSHFLADKRGTTVVETAIIAPTLLVMALGTFDVSQMVQRQNQLQSGAADVESIVLAVSNGATTDTQQVKTALQTSLGLNADQVTVEKVYRCNVQSSLSTISSCGEGQKVSTYVRVTLVDTYSPTWTEFGVGQDLHYRIRRTVQVS